MGELTRKYRPKIFDEVIGQTLAVTLLKAAARKPEKTPNSLILSGPKGTGKTTMARIFGRALSCESFNKTGKICMKCKGCLNWDKVSNKYIEYDSSMVGKVDQIKELRPVFEMATAYHRVIVFDEAQLISRAAQASLLKVFEEGPRNTFFVLCSTDPQMILDTIHSRSLPVDFYKVGNNAIKEHINTIYKGETGKDVEGQILDKLAFKADGCVRDALTLLEGYIVSGDTGLFDVPINALLRFFTCLSKGDTNGAINILMSDVIKYPIPVIQKALNYTVLQLVSTYVRNSETSTYFDIAKRYGSKTLIIFRYVSDLWVQGAFSDKYLTVSFFMTLVKQFILK